MSISLENEFFPRTMLESRGKRIFKLDQRTCTQWRRAARAQKCLISANNGQFKQPGRTYQEGFEYRCKWQPHRRHVHSSIAARPRRAEKLESDLRPAGSTCLTLSQDDWRACFLGATGVVAPVFAIMQAPKQYVDYILLPHSARSADSCNTRRRKTQSNHQLFEQICRGLLSLLCIEARALFINARDNARIDSSAGNLFIPDEAKDWCFLGTVINIFDLFGVIWKKASQFYATTSQGFSRSLIFTRPIHMNYNYSYQCCVLQGRARFILRSFPPSHLALNLSLFSQNSSPRLQLIKISRRRAYVGIERESITESSRYAQWKWSTVNGEHQRWVRSNSLCPRNLLIGCTGHEVDLCEVLFYLGIQGDLEEFHRNSLLFSSKVNRSLTFELYYS